MNKIIAVIVSSCIICIILISQIYALDMNTNTSTVNSIITGLLTDRGSSGSFSNLEEVIAHFSLDESTITPGVSRTNYNPSNTQAALTNNPRGCTLDFADADDGQNTDTNNCGYTSTSLQIQININPTWTWCENHPLDLFFPLVCGTYPDPFLPYVAYPSGSDISGVLVSDVNFSLNTGTGQKNTMIDGEFGFMSITGGAYFTLDSNSRNVDLRTDFVQEIDLYTDMRSSGGQDVYVASDSTFTYDTEIHNTDRTIDQLIDQNIQLVDNPVATDHWIKIPLGTTDITIIPVFDPGDTFLEGYTLP